MNLPLTRMRRMTMEDLPVVVRIESVCYTEIEPESAEALGAKLVASPRTCFVAAFEQTIAGYIIALPIRFEEPPALHETEHFSADDVDTLYLHDLAVDPRFRGRNLGAMLVKKFLESVEQSGLKKATLIAVQNSRGYWQKQGFLECELTAKLKDKLASYGPGAWYMELARASVVSSLP